MRDEIDHHPDREVPLVVDLDGTLTPTDTLWESLVIAVFQLRLEATAFVWWLRHGRAHAKARLAEVVTPQAQMLPLEPAVMRLIDDARAAGRPVLIASAADERIVLGMEERLGIAPAGLSSDGSTNLKGAAKASRLTERFGSHGFDYVGDSRADLSVWKSARRAYVVSPKRGVANQIKASSLDATVLGQPRNLRQHLRLCRPHQWAKNALIGVPLLTSQSFAAIDILKVIAAFAVFSALASAVYIVNDLADLEADRAHRTKAARPLASGLVPIPDALSMAALLVCLAAVLALPLGSSFVVVCAAYLVLTTAYSLGLKRLVVVDIVGLGVLFTLRIIAGAAALSIPLTPWLLAFSTMFFLALAATKRMTELRHAQGTQALPGRAYVAADLPIVAMIATGAGSVAIAMLMLYLQTPAAQAIYPRPDYLWLVLLAFVGWLYRLLILSWRGAVSDDPVSFALKDKVSYGLGGAVMVGLVLASAA